jgi:hypothetical protein
MAKFNKDDMCLIVDIGEGDYFFKEREQFIGKKVEFIRYFYEERDDEFISSEVRFIDKITVSGTEYEKGVFTQLNLKKS